MDNIVIVNYKRTPLGSFQGTLKGFTATDLGAHVIKGCMNGFDNVRVDNVLMGCVLPAGLGQAPARQAAINAGLPFNVNAMTVNKVCGSGMQTVMLAHDMIVAGTSSIAIAGGMESMSNAPYLLDKARSGYRLGHNKIIDHMMKDGLEDAYSNGKLMGAFAEDTAELYNFSREDQDNYAIKSVEKAKNNIDNLKYEIQPIEISNKKETILMDHDETPLNIDLSKIKKLKPAFKPDGTVTAASSSSIADGAGCLLLMKESMAAKLNLTPVAKIISFSSFSQDPKLFTTAPIGAINDALSKSDWQISDVDLFEINEAFAVVAMSAIKELNIPEEKVNIFGGACALGHPLGASGVRIIITLLNALRHTKQRRGLATLCVGGGEGVAITVEMIS